MTQPDHNHPQSVRQTHQWVDMGLMFILITALIYSLVNVVRNVHLDPGRQFAEAPVAHGLLPVDGNIRLPNKDKPKAQRVRMEKALVPDRTP